VLTEGISHIDDLEIGRFLDTIRRLSNQDASIEVSIKFDGSANLGFGLDENGKLYFARAVKGQSEQKRGPNDWPKKAMYNPIRSAVAALVSKKAELEKLLSPGDYVDCEVLFESIPNAIEYGKNFIVIHDANFNHVAKKLGDAKAKIDLYFYDAKKGKIARSTQNVIYSFGGKEVVNTKRYKVSVAGDLDRLEAFLEQKNKVFKDSTNFAVLSMRAAGPNKNKIVAEREKLKARIKKFQLTIKEKLIDQLLAKLPSSSIAPQPEFDEKGNNVGGSWPEGIVIKDLQTGDLSKVVSVFPVINKFLWHYREASMAGTGPAGSFVPGVMTRFKNDIAEKAFKIKILKTPGTTNSIKKKYPGVPTNKKLLQFLKDQNYKFSSFSSTKQQFSVAIKRALKALAALSDEFEENQGGSLKVKRGKFKRDVKYDPVHVRKTRETFLAVGEELEKYDKEVRGIKERTNEGSAVQLLRVFLGQRNLRKLNEWHTIDNPFELFLREEKRPGGKSIGIILGRFHPPTAGHFKVFREAIAQNDEVYVFVAGRRVDAKNPFPFSVRKKIIQLAGKIHVIAADGGFVPALIDEHINLRDVGTVNVYAGSDRIPGYKMQFKKYWEYDPHVAWNVKEIKRTSGGGTSGISGTKVREFLRTGDMGRFMNAMAGDIPDRKKEQLFKLLQKYIKPQKVRIGKGKKS